MPKEILETPSAPSALGPYNVAVEAQGLVFLSGQVGIDPVSGERVPADVEVQARRVLDNIGLILGDLGLEHSDIVKSTVFLADMADYPLVNDVYAGYFPDEPPARSAVQVAALPGGFLVEIEVVAARR